MRVLPVFLLLSACTEQSFFVSSDTNPAPNEGEIKGRVCDPSGRTWLSDAMAYTHLFNEDGELYDTRYAYSDRNGYWLLEDLPPEREYNIYIQYESSIVSEYEVWLDDGETKSIEEPDCFDPLEVDVAVITGDYDDFQLVLSNMGFANYKLIDGLLKSEVKSFLTDLESMQQYDTIFINGGFVETDVIYEEEELEEEGDTGLAEDVPEKSEEDSDTDLVMDNIRAFVEGGGTLYASDWAYDVIEIGWPQALDFVGADGTPNAAQLGEYAVVNAAVSDAALAEWLGTNYVEIEYDLPVWPPVEKASDSVSIHLTGSVSYREGTSTYNLAAVPLLVSFSAGEGKVMYSTFRMAKNATSDIVLILQYMMYNL